MSRRRWIIFLVVSGCVGLGFLPVGAAEEPHRYFVPKWAGIRGGFSSDRKADDFVQAEAYSRWDLPWDWRWCENWSLGTAADLSLGYLTDQSDDGFVGTLGPVLIVERDGVPVIFEIGSSPTILSRHQFTEADFGVFFQFTTHAGLRWQINEVFGVAYRYQHMSNAGISERNPGLDMHMFSIGFDF